jgi:hypothetical protein
VDGGFCLIDILREIEGGGRGVESLEIWKKALVLLTSVLISSPREACLR